jgi:chromosomal replication initiation ATPase DnaA
VLSKASAFVDTAPETVSDVRASAKPLRLAGLAAQMRGDVVAKRLEQAGGLFRVTEAQLLGPSRRQEIARARHVVAWLLRQDGFSFPEIGRHIGRDHTSVMNSCRRVDGERAADPEVREMLDGMVRR